MVQAWLLQKVGEEGRGGGARATPHHRNQVSLLLFPAIIPAKLGEHTPGAIAQRLGFMILSPGKYEFIPAAPASPLGLHVAPARLAVGTTSQKARASSTPSLLSSAPRVQLQGGSCQHPELVWGGLGRPAEAEALRRAGLASNLPQDCLRAGDTQASLLHRLALAGNWSQKIPSSPGFLGVPGSPSTLLHPRRRPSRPFFSPYLVSLFALGPDSTLWHQSPHPSRMVMSQDR